MTETVMVKEEPKKVAFMNRKNANTDRIEKDEQELKELLDNKNEEPTEEVKEEEPVNAEEKSFKKR